MISDIVYSDEQSQNKSKLFEKIHMAVLEINMTKRIITTTLHDIFGVAIDK